MAITNPSIYMTLPVPVVGEELGPTWATDLNTCLTILDQHSHVPGSGVQITSSALDINAALLMNDNDLTATRSVRFQDQASVIATASDIGCLSISGGDLYYNDGNGVQIRMTESGSISGTSGSITGLVSPATASYASNTFVFQSAALTSADLDAGSIILRNPTASSKGLTLAPPNAMGADYSITLPTLPAATNIVTMTTAGVLAASFHPDGSTIEVSGANLQVKVSGLSGITGSQLSASAGITGSQLSSSAGITGSQIASDVALAGAGVSAGGMRVITCNTNNSRNLEIVRGVTDISGNPISGEGFSVSHPYAGNYTVTFTTPFYDLPAITVTPEIVLFGLPPIVQIMMSSANGFTCVMASVGGVRVDAPFHFIAIGQRA